MHRDFMEYGNKEGPLLVFIHGGGVGGWMWDKQIAYFKDYHCLVPTLQGHGDRSEEISFSIRTNSIEILDLIQQKKNGRDVHLVGFSIGAQICLDLLSIAPNVITSVVINSAVVIPMKFAIPLIAPAIKLSFPLIKNKSFAKEQAKQLYMEGEYFDTYYEDSLRMKQSTLIEILKENMSFSLQDNFSECTADVLVTAGEKEKGIMKKSVMWIVERNGKCQSYIIPGVGHGFPIAQPELFNQVVKTWIEQRKIHIV